MKSFIEKFCTGTILLSLFHLFVGCSETPPNFEPEKKEYTFDEKTMSTDGSVNSEYRDTIHILCNDSSTAFPEFVLLDSTNHRMKLVDSVFTMIPQVGDTGIFTVRIGIRAHGTIEDTISWEIHVKGYWPQNCPWYTHKDDVTIGNASSLPDGYFIYNINTQSGLYKSNIRHFDPQLIPNTRADRPGSPSISDDGKWVCYVDVSRARICLLTIDGCSKTIVPVNGTAKGFPTMAGFYRNSPYGTEIYYLVNQQVLKSIHVDLSGSSPVFSNERVLVELSEDYTFTPWDFIQLSVVKDQVFTQIDPVINGEVQYRTAYLTIPDDGRGTGHVSDVYKWKNDDFRGVNGCGHTQSHDGLLCLANPGFNGIERCVPHNHRGFYITRFRKNTDPPIDMYTENFEQDAISINWCPLQYQNMPLPGADFWGWYFGNRNDLVIGRLLGTPYENGVWMVNWERSIWYQLTPANLDIQVLQPAVYFFSDTSFSIMSIRCIEDSTEKPIPYDPATDFFNPNYKVVFPNGGEIFEVGQQCTVSVTATRHANAVINISYDKGISWSQLPGLNKSINPVLENKITFTIPDSVFDGEMMVSTVSSQCLIQLIDYGNQYFKDNSDKPFSIVAKKD